jgi:hypothetical protein
MTNETAADKDFFIGSFSYLFADRYFKQFLKIHTPFESYCKAKIRLTPAIFIAYFLAL